MMEVGECDSANMRKEILRYLQIHPNAADSLNGIVDWWLPSQYKNEDVEKIEQVLEQLITDGLVKKVFLIDKTVLYKHSKIWN